MNDADPMDERQSIQAFLTAAAAKQPTPGGGSIAALAGALAASMGSMVLNYSVNKKDLQAHRVELEAALKTCERARQVLLELMVEDQQAFIALTAARKSKSTDVESFNAAVAASIRIPQAIGATAVALLSLCDRLVEKVNGFLISDLAVAADLAMATVRCASYNVRANLPDVSDTERQRFREETGRMVRQGVVLIQRINPRVNARMETTP